MIYNFKTMGMFIPLDTRFHVVIKRGEKRVDIFGRTIEVCKDKITNKYPDWKIQSIWNSVEKEYVDF